MLRTPTRDISQQVPTALREIRNEFLIFGAPLIEQSEIDEVIDSLRSGWLGTGPKVARFEEMFREYVGANHALAVNSCTAGLHLSMLAAGLGPGDEVITCPMTFAATANSVIHAGAKPILIDCERDTMNIDPKDIVRKLSDRTYDNLKAILDHLVAKIS